MPLIAAGYLNIVETAGELKKTLVAKPTQNMIDWFRAMLGPVQLRPMIPAREVARMFRLKPHQVVSVCERLHLPIYDDPVFGGLVSAKTIFTINSFYLEIVSPMRVDRQTLVTIIGRLKGKSPARSYRFVHVYFTSFEKEIQRIAKLMEPQRTIAATAFWQVFTDADLFVDLIPQDSPLSNDQHRYVYKCMVAKVKGIEKILNGKSTWEKQPYKLTGGRAFHPNLGWYDRRAAMEAMSESMKEYWRKRKAAAKALRKKD